MGRITSFSKQVIVFFLVTALIIRPTFAANVGGWTLGGGVAQGASTVYEGTKKVVIDGVDYIKKGTAKITPPASGVAKVLARGAAGYALSIAVEQLLGSVDWVLDPANNRIKYYETNELEKGFGYGCSGSSANKTLQSTLNTCNASLGFKDVQLTSKGKETLKLTISSMSIGSKKTVSVEVSVARPQNTPVITDMIIVVKKLGEVEQEEKYLPLPVIAQKVISNAEEGDRKAQVATVAVAQDIINEAETDNTKARPIAQQLESSATTKPADQAAAEKANEATGTLKPNTANPEATDLALEFPTFCGWAPTVCEAAQTVISFPQTLTDWWETGKSKSEEWATSISEAWTKVKEEYDDKPEENTDTELEIPDLEQDIEVDTDISFGGSCPAPLSSDINFMGLNKTIEFSFDPVCQIAEFIKPVVISISAFSAALIVAGIRTEDD